MIAVAPIFRLLLVAAASGLAGCASLLPAPAGHRPVTTYRLAPVLPAEATRSGTGPTVLVSLPEALPGYATSSMAYVKQRYRLDYYAYHQWVAPPAAMLRPLLAAALRSQSDVGAVVAGDSAGVLADLRLDTSILYLYQDFRTHPSRGWVALAVRLVDLSRGRVLATRIFEAEAPAPADDPYGGVVAINRALARLLPEVAKFVGDEAVETRGSRSLAGLELLRSAAVGRSGYRVLRQPLNVEGADGPGRRDGGAGSKVPAVSPIAQVWN
jgi:cholesterol transport system auxiliary component